MKMIRDLTEEEILRVAAASTDNRGRILPLTFVANYLEKAMIRPYPRLIDKTSAEVSAILNPQLQKEE